MTHPLRTRLVLCCAVLLLLAPGCQKALWQSGIRIPGLIEKPMRVESVAARGDFLDVLLASQDFSIGVYLPNDEACRSVFVEGRELNYIEGSPGGMYEYDDQLCRSVGIGTLDEWRRRRPRPRTSGSIVERGQANYQLVYQDDEVAFLRGRFPLTGLLGFVGMGDTIAVVPKTPECAAPIERNTSTIEYYPAGKKVLTLVSTRGQCNIAGLIAPFDKERPASPPQSAPNG